MNSRYLKIANIVLVCLFIAGSAASSLYSFNVYKGMGSFSPNVSTEINARLERQCTVGLGRAGFEVNRLPDGIEARGAGLSEPYSTLVKASVGIKECDGYYLKEFCMGTDCGSEVEIRLKAKFDEL